MTLSLKLTLPEDQLWFKKKKNKKSTPEFLMKRGTGRAAIISPRIITVERLKCLICRALANQWTSK